MSRQKLRVPGRYERPATLRGPLGNPVAEANMRDCYRIAAMANQARERRDPVTVPTVESAAGTVERIEIAEASGKVRKGTGAGTVAIDIIRSGWNSSGSRYYPAEVLERDIPLVYPAGTHMYVNHPGATEAEDRPERSLYDLAAVFIDTPVAVREGDQTVMRVNARVFSRHREFLEEAKSHIGVSINGQGDGNHATREGREGLVLERLTYGQSVDFVTKPGAGGKILALLESDRPVTTREAASLGAWLESRLHLGFTQIADDLYGDGRLTRPERIAASSAVGDGLAAFVAAIEKNAPALYARDRWAMPADADVATREALTREATAQQQRDAVEAAVYAEHRTANGYAWVRDFDPDAGTVWFESSDGNSPSRLYQQNYHREGDKAVLTGRAVEVRARTVYEPVTTEADAPPADGVPLTEAAITETPDGADAPAGSTTATEATTTAEEHTMTDTTVKDAAAREAAEAATRTREAFELAQYRAGDTARPIIDTLLSESDLPEIARARVRSEYAPAALPLVESTRALDEQALRTRVAASIKAEAGYVASLLEGAGVGKVTGNGAAQGAATGAPGSFFGTATQQPAAGGSFFGFPAGAVSFTESAEDKAAREHLIGIYVGRGMTREAAEIAAANN